MHPLRQARFLARLVLAWFALALGVAMAAPLVNPQSMELVCSGAGAVKLLAKGDDGSTPARSHTLDCALCVALDAPPPVGSFVVPTAQPIAGAVRSIPAAHIAALTAAPLPARGPPASLSS